MRLPSLSRIGTRLSLVALLAGATCLFAQDQPQPPNPQDQNAAPHPWRRADDPLPDQDQAQPPAPAQAQTQAEQPPPPPPDGTYRNEPHDQYGQPMGRGPRDPRYDPRNDPRNDPRADGRYDPRNDSGYDNRDNQQPAAPVPAQLTIRPGTYVTVHINQPISTAHNQQGDAFAATLARPLVVDGVVVAQRGQTIGGHVVESQRAGRISGVSKLVVQLTDLTLVDGQQVPIHSQLISRSGPTSVGSDAGAVAGTTAVGAAIGAGADWGRGAAIGAGAGAAAGILGVLLTRGHDTYLGPESVLTFRVEAPVTISTERGAQAFRYVESEDYDRPYQPEQRQLSARPGCGPYGCGAPRPYYYGYGYGYPYFGPSLAFGYGFGPRYYGGFYGRGFYGRGFYGRGRR